MNTIKANALTVFTNIQRWQKTLGLSSNMQEQYTLTIAKTGYSSRYTWKHNEHLCWQNTNSWDKGDRSKQPDDIVITQVCISYWLKCAKYSAAFQKKARQQKFLQFTVSTADLATGVTCLIPRTDIKKYICLPLTCYNDTNMGDSDMLITQEYTNYIIQRMISKNKIVKIPPSSSSYYYYYYYHFYFKQGLKWQCHNKLLQNHFT